MEAITLEELVAAVHGELLGSDVNPNLHITGAKSDNRQCGTGDVFFAFIGEKVDAHRFVNGALEKGAAGAVISELPDELPAERSYSFMPGKFYIKVPDTILAAGDLARAYRQRFDLPVVGVTGSVGKTTMKDMIASVLSQKFRTLKTEANFNNNIGLPRTILRLDRDTQMAVIEMGMNHKGEISYLVQIAKPTCAVITNIGEAHIGNLGSRENIFRAKCEIFEGLADGGFAVMNADDEFLPRLRKDADKQRRFHFTWIGESADADYRAVDIDDTLQECVKFRAITPGGSLNVVVPALGRHMIYPALASIALGQHFGMTDEEIVRGIAAYVPTALRMETSHCPHNVTIYNDAYNANPESMKAGLTTLAHTGGRITQQEQTQAEKTQAVPAQKNRVRRVAVLGDMLELGDMEEKLHREVGAFAAEQGIDTLITVGSRARWMAEAAKEHGMTMVRSYDSSEEARTAVMAEVRPDTAIYFKASHLMALEKLAAACRDYAMRQ